MSDLTLLSVEFNDYNTAFESTQYRILNNTAGKLTKYELKGGLFFCGHMICGLFLCETGRVVICVSVERGELWSVPLWNGESCGLFLCGTGRVVVCSSVEQGELWSVPLWNRELWSIPLWNRESCGLFLCGTERVVVYSSVEQRELWSIPLWNRESCGLFLCGTERVVVCSSLKRGYGYDLILIGTRIGL